MLKERREKLLESVEDEKRELIEKTKREIDEIIAALSKGDLKLHEVIELRAKLDELEENTEVVIYNEEIEVGDYVSIPSLNLNGIVKRIKDDKATVSSDAGMTLNVSVDKLHKIEREKKVSKVKKSDTFDTIMKLNVGLELNIIGMHVDEARDAIIKYLDDCRVKHFKVVRIIHGFGSGALRKLTHEILSKQKDLTYRLGQANEGAGGATVIEFK